MEPTRRELYKMIDNQQRHINELKEKNESLQNWRKIIGPLQLLYSDVVAERDRLIISKEIALDHISDLIIERDGARQRAVKHAKIIDISDSFIMGELEKKNASDTIAEYEETI